MATCPKCGTRYSSTVRICTHDGTVLNNDEATPDPQIAILNPEAELPWAGHMGVHALPEIYLAIQAHRTVLILHEFEEMEYKEIARTMDCSIGTVMSRLFYARRKMAALLANLKAEELQ